MLAKILKILDILRVPLGNANMLKISYYNTFYVSKSLFTNIQKQ